jgi:hypothetical protein
MVCWVQHAWGCSGGDYARGIFSDSTVNIKVGAETMDKAQKTFNNINLMEPAKRALFFMDSTTDLHEQAGYAWTPEYKLVKAAPGLGD